EREPGEATLPARIVRLVRRIRRGDFLRFTGVGG
ncbi:MAG: hypothetical protein AVDCRST_MAG70-2249, partial [uncultured Thermomicrobiales bacterium]